MLSLPIKFRHSLLLVLLFNAGFVQQADSRVNTPDEVDPYQVFFVLALKELHQKHYASAIGLLQALNKEVNTARIRLELARAYFLDRQYVKARELFQTVLKEPELPWGVRENVERYLDLIDEALGSIKFSLAFVSDSNPLNFTDHRRILVFGQELEVIEPSNNKTVHGMQYGINLTHALADDATWVAYLNANYKDFAGSDFDRLTADAGIAYFPRDWRELGVKLGLEDGYYAGNHLYRQPYTAITLTPDPVNRFRFSGELKLAKLNVPDLDYLDAQQQMLSLRASRILEGGAQLRGNLFAENARTDEQAYSYRGLGLGTSLSVPLIQEWGMELSGSFRMRNYRDTDPFFGERRKDTASTLGVTFFNRHWSVYDLTPEVGVTYERTESNLAFYEYDKVNLIFRARQ